MLQSGSDSVILAEPNSGKSLLQALNAGAVIVAALYFGQQLLVPLVLATLLAFVLAPVCVILQKVRIPRVGAVIVAVVLAFSVIGSIGMVVGRQAAVLTGSLPAFQATIEAKWMALATGNGMLRHIVGSAGAHAPGKGAAGTLGLDGANTLTIAREVATPLLGPLSTAGIVLIFTIFILLYSEDLRDRLVRLVGRRDLHRTILAMNDAARRLSRYFLFQLALNASFGTLIGLCLWGVGLPNPVLWGILSALMRFVPFIGTFIALLPPLVLALAVAPGWSMAFAVAGLFIVSELVMGQVVEPLIYGHSTGLSPIAVIVATAFWALLWGPVGLLLATPLTVCLVVIGRHVEPLAFLDVIFGDSSPLEPAETFYQRALEGNAAVMVAGARQRIAETSLAEYYDTVALSGLALAQGDLSRDALAFERLESIHTQIGSLLTIVANTSITRDLRTGIVGAIPEPWSAEGSIICIPGRGQLDDLAAGMAVQVLANAGFGARVEDNLVLGAGKDTAPDFARVRLCCLSLLEEGNTASGIRYFILRMRKRMPDAIVVVCLWHAVATSPLLSELRVDGKMDHVILSIGELLALVRAVSARRDHPAATMQTPVELTDIEEWAAS